MGQTRILGTPSVVNPNLEAIGALSPADGTVIVRRSGAWVAETISEVGRQLALTNYAPGVVQTYSTTSTTMADVSAVNAAVTFTGPAGGWVCVEASAVVSSADTSTVYAWALRAGGATVSGSEQRVAALQGFMLRAHYRAILVVTPGTSYTWKLAHRLQAGTSAGTYADDGIVANPVGPLSMRVTVAQ